MGKPEKVIQQGAAEFKITFLLEILLECKGLVEPLHGSSFVSLLSFSQSYLLTSGVVFLNNMSLGYRH